MTRHDTDIAEDEPLDPAFEAVRRKMVRLLAVSMGVMFVGIAAVLVAVVWRLNQSGPDGPTSAALIVPQGFLVDSAQANAERVTLVGRLPDGVQKVLVFDGQTGEIIANFAISAEKIPD